MIGLFDSGVGGLSVARELRRQSPTCPLIYLADQGHAPYGPRPLTEIRDFAGGIARFLLAQGAQIIVVACNTASAAALHWLRRAFPAVPFVGMEPALKPAAERTRTRHVGVIATAATFQGELFASLVERFAADVAVHTQVCAELAPLIEAGELDSVRTRAAVHSYLAPLVAAGIDELVLGCTHYPFLRPLIEEVVGPHIEIIDPAEAVARQAARILARYDGCDKDHAVADPRPRPADRFFTTGDPARFQAALERLLGWRTDVQAAFWTATGELNPFPG